MLLIHKPFLSKLKLGEVVTTIPTIGFNVETVDIFKASFTIWDVSGRGKIRALWRHYFQNTQALVYVVDCNDRERMEENEMELTRLMGDDELRDAVLLVYANKMDLPNAMTQAEVTDKLGLAKLRQRSWHVQPCAAHSGDGLYEGFEWLSEKLTGTPGGKAIGPSVAPNDTSPSLQTLPSPASVDPTRIKGLGSSGDSTGTSPGGGAGKTLFSSLLGSLGLGPTPPSPSSPLQTTFASLDDEAFLQALNGEKPPSLLLKSDLGRAAFLALRAASDRVQALALFPEQIKLIIARRRAMGFDDPSLWNAGGEDQGDSKAVFHATLVHLWGRLVLHKLATHGDERPETFAALVPSSEAYRDQFMACDVSIVLEYYSPEAMNSPSAFVQFSLPDRKPLPPLIFAPPVLGIGGAAASESPKENLGAQELGAILASDDAIFTASLLGGAVMPVSGRWGQYDGLRVAFCCLVQFGRRMGLVNYGECLSAVASQGLAPRHETLEYLRFHLCHFALANDIAAESPPLEDGRYAFGAFIGKHADLLHEGFWELYYTKQALADSPKAAQEVVLPDKKPFPSIIPRAQKGAAGEDPGLALATTLHRFVSSTTDTAPWTDGSWWYSAMSDDDFLIAVTEGLSASSELTAWWPQCTVRLVYLHLFEHLKPKSKTRRAEIVECISVDLKAFSDRTGLVEKHETMLLFTVTVVHAAIAACPPGAMGLLAFGDFAKAQPHCLDPRLYRHYYSDELMSNTPRSRDVFALPDIQQLPSLVV